MRAIKKERMRSTSIAICCCAGGTMTRAVTVGVSTKVAISASNRVCADLSCSSLDIVASSNWAAMDPFAVGGVSVGAIAAGTLNFRRDGGGKGVRKWTRRLYGTQTYQITSFLQINATMQGRVVLSPRRMSSVGQRVLAASVRPVIRCPLRRAHTCASCALATTWPYGGGGGRACC